ncbi:hypothetical protein KC19_6G072200 [Ceratodon purpureus]|uniref:Uncharacterized protein n=1 Tax=Ceratodon purpureus TaxID=3225 RepID=A0A8T0HFW7_CERPU|nr:hypothetical protein KC19_6G072200 [Ceratodon purpureus]
MAPNETPPSNSSPSLQKPLQQPNSTTPSQKHARVNDASPKFGRSTSFSRIHFHPNRAPPDASIVLPPISTTPHNHQNSHPKPTISTQTTAPKSSLPTYPPLPRSIAEKP